MVELKGETQLISINHQTEGGVYDNPGAVWRKSRELSCSVSPDSFASPHINTVPIIVLDSSAR